MDVSEARRSSSSSLMDQVAHEANMVRKEEHVAGDATGAVGQQVERQVDDSILRYLGAKNDTIRLGYANDATVVGLGQALYGDGFAIAEAKKRPGMAQSSATNFSNHLNGTQDASLKAVLQSRADDGFVIAQFAHKAVSYLPADQQPAAATKWLQDNYGDRLNRDAAFATGVNYNAYLRTTKGDAAVDTEMTGNIQNRSVQNPGLGKIAG